MNKLERKIFFYELIDDQIYLYNRSKGGSSKGGLIFLNKVSYRGGVEKSLKEAVEEHLGLGNLRNVEIMVKDLKGENRPLWYNRFDS